MRDIIKHSWVLSILIWCQCASYTALETQSSRPNIILFLVDDLGWQDTSVPFGSYKTAQNDFFQTPNMERLAQQGVIFRQAYATPVCTPSRVSLMTGMNAARHRVTNWTMMPDVRQPMELNHEELNFPFWNVNGMTPDSSQRYAAYATPLAQVLQDHGYTTIHVGKAHLGAVGTLGADPHNLGFEINIGGHAAGQPQSYLGGDNYGNTSDSNMWAVPGLEKYHGQDVYLTEALTQEAIAAMSQAMDAGHPFFLNMSPYAVHTPLMGHPRYMQRYIDLGLDSVEARYASMIQGMDAALGDIMDFSEQKGIADNTIILFMSDNGGLSAHTRAGDPHTHNKPLASGKGSIYEGGIRVPMIVSWPEQISEVKETAYPVIIEDFYPSILEFAGIDQYDVAQVIDGRSFKPILHKGDLGDTEKALFWHYPNEWGITGPGIGAASAIRKGDMKLIYYHATGQFELFDINNDIGEMHDLSTLQPRIVGKLALELQGYLQEVGAQMPAVSATGKPIPYPADALGAAIPEAYHYNVSQISNGMIVIDGWKHEEQWAEAVDLYKFQYSWMEGDPQPTSFKALYDDQYLYFYYHAIDNEIIVPEHLGSSDDNVLASDRVEIFFRSPDLREDYVALEIDARGRMFDSKNQFYLPTDASWNYDPQELTYQAVITSEGYQLEGKISLTYLSNMGYLKHNEIIAGLYRGDYSSNDDDKKSQVAWSSWVDVPSQKPDFHVPCSFGRLILE